MTGRPLIRSRECPPMSRGRIVAKTIVQTVLFWGTFLFLIPAGISLLESKMGWLDHRFATSTTRIIGIALFAVAGTLGLTSGATMAIAGHGTPVPFDCAPRLVIAGPYRFIRNPMVVAGIAQGIAVGMFLGSWLVIIYSLCGALVWDWIIRPWEERDLVSRFGHSYEDYRRHVRCWVPRMTAHRVD